MATPTDPKQGFSTLAVHAGQSPDSATGAIMTPVYLTSTYVQEWPDRHKGFDYARTVHPTRLALEKNLAALEGASFGLCFGSGMAATSTVIQALSSGDHVLCSNDLYGGTYRVFTKVFARFGVTFTFVDATKLKALEEAFTPKTKLVWIESPSNPLLRISDIRAVAKLAHSKGAKLVIDNTFASPALQRPLSLGADVVVHSTTKYLGGHSDVVGGAVLTSDEELFKEYKFLQNAVGAVPGPLDCFLVLRGTKTLALRIERHCANAEHGRQTRDKPPSEHLVQFCENLACFFPLVGSKAAYEPIGVDLGMKRKIKREKREKEERENSLKRRQENVPVC